MELVSSLTQLSWTCRHTWPRASKNTLWCLTGCSIGDWGTILYFQLTEMPWPTLWIMLLAIVNGILTSITLETIVLSRQMAFKTAFRTAIGMSLISMLAMEIAMNVVDVALTGGAVLTLWVIPVMFTAGFFAAVPYNYWRLKALGKACH
ncbi:MAG TPA: DUF4396 domain-containing protein [Gammaproteobacteria bacterium]|nr:DUF4396 domain-containing protein [Arenicellales bacterium]HIM70167.1 DUF4396 domain-containing protein [Gammaproteobacteria bacterium]